MESSIQNKLSNYEQVPPDKVWNRIDAALDENEEHLLAERLSMFTSVPPPETWQKISRLLNAKKISVAVVLPFYKKYRRPLKYTGAAAVITILAILTSLLISKKTISEVPLQPSVVAKEALKKNSTGELNQEGTEVNARSKTQAFASNIRASADPIRKTNLLGIQSQSGTLALLNNILPKTVQRKNSITSDARTEHYMIYSDEEGHAVRLPKKLFDAFACPVEQVSCKQKLKRIQEKIAASAQSADFAGILEIVNTLQENQ